jgi:hypothetical protein
MKVCSNFVRSSGSVYLMFCLALFTSICITRAKEHTSV